MSSERKNELITEVETKNNLEVVDNFEQNFEESNEITNNENEIENKGNVYSAFNAAPMLAIAQNFITNPYQNEKEKINKQDLNDKTPNEKDVSLNYSSVTNSPIEMFYKYINGTIDSVFNDYFVKKFNKYKPIVKNIYKLTNDISNLEESIILKKKELQYTKRRWKNALFIIGFIFIIGFFFWSKYKANLIIIHEFKEFKNQQDNHIMQSTNNRFALMQALFSTMTLFDLYRYTFERYGIKTSELLPVSKILKLLDNKNNIDIRYGISGLYKNTPFYDVLVRSLVWRNITTSRSQSFPYTAYETVTDSNGRTRIVAVTKYETLTAYHHENTPFIDTDNILVYMTHYEPKLLFSINNKKHNKYIELENDKFVKSFGLDASGDAKNDLSVQQRINQFFTIKAQEDYLEWLNLNNGKVFDFFKLKNHFCVFNNSYDFSSLGKGNSFIEDIGILENNTKIDFDDLTSKFKNIGFNYFEKITRMMQLPLLSPTINREWYKHNSNDYMIANNLSDASANVDDISNVDTNYIILKFLDPKFLWFNSKFKASKPIWFNLNNSMQSKKGIIHSHYNMNSYWSQMLIDYVTVVGFHVGAKIIAVPYEKFHFFTEEKFLSYLYSNDKNIPKIIITPHIKHIICKELYSESFADLLSNNGVWINDPNWLENFSNIKELMKIVARFNELNTNLQWTLAIDEHGFYFISNDVDTNNEIVESILLELKSIFSK